MIIIIIIIIVIYDLWAPAPRYDTSACRYNSVVLTSAVNKEAAAEQTDAEVMFW
jgi:hypothetical protein